MPLTTRSAVVLEKDAPFEIRDLELREPRPNEVIVEVSAVGVCHTDIIMQQQFFPVSFPAVFGHEGAGIVRQIGSDVTKVRVGDHVVLGFASCAKCRNCLRGLPSYCLYYYDWNFKGRLLDDTTALTDNGQDVAAHFFGQSSFSRYALCAERNVVLVDPEVDLAILGPLGCGIQTGAGAVLNSLKVEAGSSIAVFGAGGVGLSAVMAAVVAGATTIAAVDVDPARLRLAKELGATHVIDARSTDLMADLGLVAPEGFMYTIESTGRPDVLVQAVDILMVTGVCGTIGASPMGTTAAINMNNLIFGRTIRGICEGDSVPEIFIPQLIELYKQGRFPFDKLISRYAFEDINLACDDAKALKAVKPVLVF
ncbi:NAD(P)-dependent alcohol dehydrogenase [Paenarthrobacter sp. OM7]|uniref:NAD(P)-dependent alcohol dehydrogenase n=1 Tax=Paenarthrobacter sp. AMU7 TaxID=3162492 RepID=A0AB39YR22_9MICC|nr:NAD(P)-dependent alcohol dehydrogenase [Paenarthrobacter sp. OM7]WGM20430.1 NAD(P)-dependent alcohol dehydrogenase [Paenarthrobacter sp. OM7]